jgi:hypothetical protein
VIIFDGDQIEAGDRVYDLRREKVCNVLKTYTDRMLVGIPGEGSVTFNYAGVERTRTGKTLFWHDPRFLVPRKSAEEWSIQRSTLRAMMHYMGEFMRMAHVIDDEPEQELDALPDSSNPFLDSETLRSMARPADS